MSPSPLGGISTARTQSSASLWLARVFQVYGGEGLPLLVLLAHAFFKGLSQVFFETAANSYFLSHFSASSLPYVYLLAAGVSVALGAGYAKVQPRIRPRTLLHVILALLILSAATFAVSAMRDTPGTALALMVWKDVHYILVNIEFWAVVMFLFDLRQGKRLFPLILAGEILATIAGGASTPWIADRLGLGSLLLLAAAAVGGCLVMLTIMTRAYAARFSAAFEGAHCRERPIRSLLRDRYLALLFSISIVSYLGYYLLDFVFYNQVESRHASATAIAGFFGAFYAVLGVANLVANTFVAGRLFSRYGIVVGLLALPAVVFAASLLSTYVFLALSWFGVFFWIVVAAKLLDEVLRVAFQIPLYQMLYQPLAEGIRLRVQAIRESMIEPLSIGLSGLLLLGLTATGLARAIDITRLLLLVVGAWIGLALLMRRQYSRTVAAAIATRRLPAVTADERDSFTRELVARSLATQDPIEIAFCLDLLRDAKPAIRDTVLERLLRSDLPDVRRAALVRVDAAFAGPIELVERDLDAGADALRAAAVGAFCAIRGADAIDRVLPLLDESPAPVRSAALAALLRSCGIDGILAGGVRLGALVASADVGDRRQAAEVLAQVAAADFYRPLERLLADRDASVRALALRAAASVKSARLVPALLRLADDVASRAGAVRALVSYGEVAVPPLRAALASSETALRRRMRIARILGRIGGAAATNALVDQIHCEDRLFRHAVLRSLVRARYRASERTAPRIRTQIASEARDGTVILSAITHLGGVEEAALVRSALEHELAEDGEAILLLLTFICPAETILDVRLKLASASTAARAYALEVLDNVLPRDLRQLVLPLFDDAPAAERLKALSAATGGQLTPPGSAELATDLTRSRWTRISTVFSLRGGIAGDVLSSMGGDPDPVVRETAAAVSSPG